MRLGSGPGCADQSSTFPEVAALSENYGKGSLERKPGVFPTPPVGVSLRPQILEPRRVLCRRSRSSNCPVGRYGGDAAGVDVFDLEGHIHCSAAIRAKGGSKTVPRDEALHTSYSTQNIQYISLKAAPAFSKVLCSVLDVRHF